MTFKEEITALQERIAKAESERDTWRASGMQENYLEAYSRVEALELQLEGLRQQGLRTFAEAAPAAPVLAAAPGSAAERERLMAEFSITYNGRHYQYDRYRYDGLADAVDYARLPRSALSGNDGADPMPPAEKVEAPDESQRQVMAEFAITFRDGVYRLGEFRYDRLADVLNYARLQRLQVRRP